MYKIGSCCLLVLVRKEAETGDMIPSLPPSGDLFVYFVWGRIGVVACSLVFWGSNLTILVCCGDGCLIWRVCARPSRVS